MRIATFNVHMWSDRDGRSAIPATIDLLRSLRADAIVLQEVPERFGTLARVAAALGMHVAFAPASFLGNALLSSAPPLSFEIVALSSGLAERRAAFVSRLPWEGGSLTIAGTHLDHLLEHHRLEQLESLLHGLDELPDAGLVLLAGDLNAVRLADYDAAALKRIRTQREQNGLEPPMGDVTARLEAGGWIDLWREARALGPEGQQVASGGCARYGNLGTCWFGTRVDYLLAAASFHRYARLVGCERIPSAVSDHLPVVAELVPRV